MSDCEGRLYDAAGLACVLDAGHEWGHSYIASWAADRHDEAVSEQ